MSARGQERNYPGLRGTSVLPSGADIFRLHRDIRQMPQTDVNLVALASSGCWRRGTIIVTRWQAKGLHAMVQEQPGWVGRRLPAIVAADVAG
jgi:hypothetical protein